MMYNNLYSYNQRLKGQVHRDTSKINELIVEISVKINKCK